MKLRIYNVSDYIHAGGAPKKDSSLSPSYYAGIRELPDGSYAASRLPTGGISFMLNQIIERLVNRDEDEILVFCVDDTPKLKRQIYYEVLNDETGYKGTRGTKTLEISIQRESIRDILSLISPNTLFFEGYEADDIIVALVKKYKSTMDHIYIHTRDKDLYCLVDDNVSIEPVGTRGDTVTKDNFSRIVKGHKGNYLPFNTILLDKLIYGDKSDNIPGIGEYYLNKINQFITPDKYHYLVNLNLFRTWVGVAVGYDPKVMGIVDLLLPIPIDEDHIEIYEEKIDFNKLYYLGKLVGNKYCKRVDISTGDYPEINEILNYYTDDFYMRGGSI